MDVDPASEEEVPRHVDERTGAENDSRGRRGEAVRLGEERAPMNTSEPAQAENAGSSPVDQRRTPG